MAGLVAAKAVLRQQMSRKIAAASGQFTTPEVLLYINQWGGGVISLAAEKCPSAGKQSPNNPGAISQKVRLRSDRRRRLARLLRPRGWRGKLNLPLCIKARWLLSPPASICAFVVGNKGFSW
jgi:hypothetical protein